jgi:hypothetical protein
MLEKFFMNVILIALVFNKFCNASSTLIGYSADEDAATHSLVKMYNLIEYIATRHNNNLKFWILALPHKLPFYIEFSLFHETNNMPKMLYMADYHLNLSDRKDYAAIFFGEQTNDNRIENWLNMSLKLPPDLIKIYVSVNDCFLNDSMLLKNMRQMWSIGGIGFIYYISLCMSHNRDNYGQQPHRDNYIMNLFYYQPFQKHKSEQQQDCWGGVEKINLINVNGGNEWLETSSEAFHYFPFQAHKLNFNGYKLTAILFPSTMAYFKSDTNIFKKYLSTETLNDPYHNVEAYFGEDVEALLEMQRRLNFSIILSPTSDMGFYGFKVRQLSFFLIHIIVYLYIFFLYYFAPC